MGLHITTQTEDMTGYTNENGYGCYIEQAGISDMGNQPWQWGSHNVDSQQYSRQNEDYSSG